MAPCSWPERNGSSPRDSQEMQLACMSDVHDSHSVSLMRVVTVSQPIQPASPSISQSCSQSASQPACVCVCVSHQVPVECKLVVQDLIGLDLNVSGLTLGTTQGLMDHDAAVGKAVALALGVHTARRAQHSTAQQSMRHQRLVIQCLKHAGRDGP